MNYKMIPKEDMLISLGLIKPKEWTKEYRDCVYCECGNDIWFKNREKHEIVMVKCPECGFEIIYG